MEIALNQNTTMNEADRVRQASPPDANRKIDTQLERQVRFYACQDNAAISERLRELDREWDIERALMANAASVSLFGASMGLISGRKWLLLPAIVGVFSCSTPPAAGAHLCLSFGSSGFARDKKSNRNVTR